MFKLGHLIYSISGGLVINATTAQTGKGIGIFGQVMNIEDNLGNKFSPIDIGFRIRPVIGTQLYKNWSLTLQPQWTFSQSLTTINGEDLGAFHHQLNLNLGLGYNF